MQINLWLGTETACIYLREGFKVEALFPLPFFTASREAVIKSRKLVWLFILVCTGHHPFNLSSIIPIITYTGRQWHIIPLPPLIVPEFRTPSIAPPYTGEPGRLNPRYEQSIFLANHRRGWWNVPESWRDLITQYFEFLREEMRICFS